MLRRWGFMVLSCALPLLTLVLTAALTTAVAAQTEESSDDAARRHFRLGQAHYENGAGPMEAAP